MTSCPQNLSETALRAIATALEELAFLPVEPVPSLERTALEKPTKWAKVDAHGGGEAVRSFAVVMPESLVAQVAATVLGISEDEVGQPELRDTIAEIANMGCGSLMRMLAEETTFGLGLPVGGDGDVLSEPAGAGILREQLEVNGIRMDVVIECQ
jgi:hypothetical protein